MTDPTQPTDPYGVPPQSPEGPPPPPYGAPPPAYGAAQPPAYGAPPPPAYGAPPPQAYGPPQGYGPPQAYGPAPGYPAAPVGQQTNGLAVAALVVGVIALVICWVPFVGALTGIVGLGLGIAALVRSSRLGGNGRGAAVAGTVLSGLALLAGIVITSIAISLFGTVVDCADPDLTQSEQEQCVQDRLEERFN